MGKGLDKFRKQAIEFEEKAKSKTHCKTMSDEILSYMEDLDDIDYDERLSRDDKSFESLFYFLKRKAKAQATDGVAYVADCTVRDWVNEYVWMDKTYDFHDVWDTDKKPSKEFTDAFNKLLEIFKERDEQFKTMLKLCVSMVKKEAM